MSLISSNSQLPLHIRTQSVQLLPMHFNPHPIMVNKSFYLLFGFFHPIYKRVILSTFCHQHICRFICHPSSSAKITICRHTRTSAIVGFRIFSHR
ncbi:hypothetical protein ERO13_A05G361300v2 [Gossypium hirsutum]|nr:hypothetical protein ERO13_A05G361300v2 [Gossypium hirsutum]